MGLTEHNILYDYSVGYELEPCNGSCLGNSCVLVLKV